MNNINDNEKLKALLKLTAEKLGTTPENLKTAASDGNMSKILSENANQNLKDILSNPEKAKKLLSSKQAQDLMKALGLNGKEN